MDAEDQKVDRQIWGSWMSNLWLTFKNRASYM